MLFDDTALQTFTPASLWQCGRLLANDPNFQWSLMPLNCSSLYSAVAGALSMQAVKATFLSPEKTGIATLFDCFPNRN